jgi:hypothetical protein
MVPATCTFVGTASSADSLCGQVSSFTAQVGSIGLELTIDHPSGQPRDTVTCWAEIEEILGPADRRYFGSAYAATQCALRDIQFDAARERVQAVLDLDLPHGLPPLQGMGASYFPFVSPANTIVSIAQLAQAMLYLHDDISRDVSHNLWMRKIALEHPRPVPSGRGLNVETWSTKMNLLSVKDATWRSGSFGLAMPGVTGTYNLAHQLPNLRAHARA